MVFRVLRVHTRSAPVRCGKFSTYSCFPSSATNITNLFGNWLVGVSKNEKVQIRVVVLLSCGLWACLVRALAYPYQMLARIGLPKFWLRNPQPTLD
jgi:hypothetical protein